MSKKLLHFIIAMFVLITGLFALYRELWHLPLQAEAQALHAQTLARRREITWLKNYAAAHPNPAAHQAEIEQTKARLDALLPPQMSEGRFLHYLNEQVNRQNIRLLSVTPETVTRRDDDISVLPVRVALRLDYFTLLEFLAELETSPRFVNVRNLKIKSDGSQLDCELLLLIYAYESKNL